MLVAGPGVLHTQRKLQLICGVLGLWLEEESMGLLAILVDAEHEQVCVND